MTLRSRRTFFLLFALSGFSGLIYESIWTHYLKLFLGHAAYAQALVLAIFMGGTALGSWAAGSWSPRWRNLLLGYAAAEGAIGLAAIVFHPAFVQALRISYASVLPRLGSPAGILAFKWTLGALLILPQSVLLGMTFPLMSGGLLRHFPERPGRSLALLYFSNSLGAVLGVLASGFVLIRAVGLPGTIRVAGCLNLVLAFAVWRLVKALEPAPAHAPASERMDGGELGPGWSRFLLAASLCTGTASFLYEIGWIRMLGLVLGSSTHAFELMLSAFIFGLALGGLWINRRVDRSPDPVRLLGLVQVVMGACAVATLPLYGNTFHGMRWLVKTLPRTDGGYALFNLASGGLAMAVMLPATFCAGMTLPLITYVLLRGGRGEGSIGRVYSANTVGAILGVFFGIHLMPVLGLKGLILSGATLDLGLGLALLWSAERARAGQRRLVLVASAAVLATLAAGLLVRLDPYKLGSGVYRFGELPVAGPDRVLYHRDGKTATISCFQDEEGVTSLRTNGKTDAAVMMPEGKEPTADESTMTLLAAIPMVYHPEARTAAAIGLGSGMSSHVFLCNPRLQEVDTVEIERAVVDGAKAFGARVALAFEDPRSRIYIDDAKTFFASHGKRYDIILSEPSNPWVSGVSGLFSLEFYDLVNRHLNEGGLFAQWIQLYEIDDELVASVLKAVSARFSDYAVFWTDDTNAVILARKGGRLGAPGGSLFSSPKLAEALRRARVESLGDISLRRVGSKALLDPLLSTFAIRANSDYFPVLDQKAARTRFLQSSAEQLFRFSYLPLPVGDVLSPESGRQRRAETVASPYFGKSQAALNARAIRDYLVDGRFGLFYRDGEAVRELASHAFQVRQQLFSRGGASDELSALGSLHAVGLSLIPYLPPEELEGLWRALRRAPYATSLPARELQWLTLLEAVSRRDPAGMATAARTSLADSAGLPAGAVSYLVATGMLGSVAQGDRAGAEALWRKFQPAVSPENRPVFQALLAEGAGGGPPGTSH